MPPTVSGAFVPWPCIKAGRPVTSSAIFIASWMMPFSSACMVGMLKARKA